MKNIGKFKVNVKKWIAYTLLIISCCYITLLTINMFWDLKNLTNLGISKGLKEGSEELASFIALSKKTWIIQYIASALLTGTFILFTMFGMAKITVGKIYLFFWIIVWTGFAIAPFILQREISAFIIITIILVVGIITTLFFILKDIYETQKDYKYYKAKHREYKF